MRRLGKGVGVGLLGLAVPGMTLWGMGALYYSALPALLGLQGRQQVHRQDPPGDGRGEVGERCRRQRGAAAPP